MATYIYFFYVGLASRLLPFITGIRRWSAVGRAGQLLVGFVGLSIAGDVTQWVTAKNGLNNQWVAHLLIGVQTPVLVLAFAEWADHPRLRRTLRSTALAAPVVWAVLTLAFESLTRFARVTGPLQAGLFCLVAALVLFRRALASEVPLSRSDWFFVCLGVLLVYSITAVARPLLDLFTAKGETVIPGISVWKTFMVLQTIANFLYARALYLAGRPYARAAPAVA